MRDEMFAGPWLDVRLRPGSAEPELGLRSAGRSSDPLSGTENSRRGDPSSPPDPLPKRAPRLLRHFRSVACCTSF